MVEGKKRFILTLDGGGIRGIIPAMVLAEVEARAGKPVCEMFDMIAGTSTGAILAAGICLVDESGRPMYTPDDILQVYEQQGPTIFPTGFIRSWGRWIYGSKYSEVGLESILETYFGDSQLDNTFTRMMVPAYNVTSDKPVYFKSWVSSHRSLLLKDVLRAATAAPTFFKPKNMKIPKRNESEWEDALLYDGAIHSNNISTCAYVDALQVFPNDEIHVLSIGTGDNKVFSDSQNPGTLPFADTLVSMIFSASEDVVNYQMKRLIQDRYTRVQLTKESQSFISLDDTSPKAIQTLKDDARKVISDHSSVIDQFIATCLDC